MKNLLIVFIVLLSSQFAYSSGYVAPFDNEATIDKVVMHDNGGVTLWITAMPKNPDSCTNSTLAYIKTDLTGRNNMVSAALMAFAAKKKVGLWSSGCEILPFWGGTLTSPIINTLWVVD